MTRFLLAFAGALFLGSIAAFLLFVPPVLIAAVSVATVALLMLGFILTFWFSIRVELQPTLPSETCPRPVDQL
jgi:hypothetical protein